MTLDAWNGPRRPLDDPDSDATRRAAYWAWSDEREFTDRAMPLWDLGDGVSWHLIGTESQADFEAKHMRHSIGYDFGHYSEMANPPSRSHLREEGGLFSLRRDGVPFATALLSAGRVVHAVGIANATLTDDEHAILARVCARSRWDLPDAETLAGHAVDDRSPAPRYP